MTLNAVLQSLLERLGATGKTVLVDWHSVLQWPPDALRLLNDAGILSPASPAQSIECRLCDKRCYMDVLTLPGAGKRPSRFFIICEDAEMQSQVGRILVPPEHLQQWKITTFQLASTVARQLAIEGKTENPHGKPNIRIGMLRGEKGRRWLILRKSPLALTVHEHALPLEEVLFFEDDQLRIDRERIQSLVDAAPITSGKHYTPSTKRREAGKLETEAIHADWQDEYQRQRRKHPDPKTHSDSWIARQIARLPIARGRSPDTIRKNMKK